MDVKQIERLEALLAKATPGPWQAMNPYQWDSIIGDIDGPDDGDMHYESVTDITSHHDRSRANAALIAEAISALPALLQLARAVNEAEQLLRKSAKEHEDAGDDREMDEASRNWHAGLSQAYEDGADMLRAALGQTVALVPVPVKEGK